MVCEVSAGGWTPWGFIDRKSTSLNGSADAVICGLMFTDDHDGRKQDDKDTVVDKELEEAFNTWKSKSFALTVPLKVVALRGSIPPSWIKVCDTYSLFSV